MNAVQGWKMFSDMAFGDCINDIPIFWGEIMVLNGQISDLT